MKGLLKIYFVSDQCFSLSNPFLPQLTPAQQHLRFQHLLNDWLFIVGYDKILKLKANESLLSLAKVTKNYGGTFPNFIYPISHLRTVNCIHCDVCGSSPRAWWMQPGVLGSHRPVAGAGRDRPRRSGDQCPRPGSPRLGRSCYLRYGPLLSALPGIPSLSAREGLQL